MSKPEKYLVSNKKKDESIKKEDYNLYFDNNKKKLENKILKNINVQNIFNETVIQDITNDFILFINKIHTLNHTYKCKIIKKIYEIIQIDIKINYFFKKLVNDIKKLLFFNNQDTTNKFNKFKEKIVNLQKNLFIFQVRTIFTKIKNIKDIIIQNIDNIIFSLQQKNTTLFLQKFYKLVEVIDDKINNMNIIMDNIEIEEKPQIQKYKIIKKKSNEYILKKINLDNDNIDDDNEDDIDDEHNINKYNDNSYNNSTNFYNIEDDIII